jgi:UDP-N-acetylglucosamine 2-epimerase (non-hydrolysing)
MKIISVVGARPNFMKVAPIHKAFEKFKIKNLPAGRQRSKLKTCLPVGKVQHMICHTGQHYDANMSDVFFKELNLPKPDFYLGVGSGSHSEQTAKIMIEFEKVLLKEKPDLVIVVGDVNSTVACSLVAGKMGIKIAHVEAGLRSFDDTMPEEINRIVTDHISNYLFVTEPSGLFNLRKEGIDDSKVHFVGNVMIDNLVDILPGAENSNAKSTFNLGNSKYILITLHRPTNVDSREFLEQFLNLANRIPAEIKILFPVHPRTGKNILANGLKEEFERRIIITEPLGYVDFLSLLKDAEMVITDSGGIQEESTYLGVQCATLRDNTERPVTIDTGTNRLLGTDLSKVEGVIFSMLNGNKKEGRIPELWDGKASERIVEILMREAVSD